MLHAGPTLSFHSPLMTLAGPGRNLDVVSVGDTTCWQFMHLLAAFSSSVGHAGNILRGEMDGGFQRVVAKADRGPFGRIFVRPVLRSKA